MSMIRKAIAAVAAAGVMVSAMPAASAQAPDEWRSATMSIPLMENHTVSFSASTGCSVATHSYQVFSARIYDRKADAKRALRFAFLPFDQLNVKWKNLATGQEGALSKSDTGGNPELVSGDTGQGDLEVTVTYTRSLLPMVVGSSVPGVSASHTETFTLPAYDVSKCDNLIGQG